MTSSSTGTPRTAEDIVAWLRERVSYYLRQPAETIDPDSSLVAAGLDSVYAFALTAEIEDAFGIQLEPTLIWDVDTLNALTSYVVKLATD